jgi:pimeloyl-ACP methyl ester carboxylesterase
MKSRAVALSAFLFLLMQSWASAAPGDGVYTRPGKLIAASDGARLNFYCMGSGSPAVIFDSGFEDWAPAWAVVQPRVAKWTRACTYDRAGAGFSDAGPMPRTNVRIADELRSALHNFGIAGPYILVAHAFGGDNVRAFADRYMKEVAGLLLVDADPSDVESADMRSQDDRGIPAAVAQLRACRDAVAQHKPLPMMDTRPGKPPRTCAQQFFRGLPEAQWSAQLNAKLLEIAQTKVAMYDAYMSEWEQFPWDETWLQQNVRSFGARPIRVITTGHHGIGSLEGLGPMSAKRLIYEDDVKLAQARWLTLSTNAKQIFTHHSSEYVQFDEPDTVVNAIREVYDQGK